MSSTSVALGTTSSNRLLLAGSLDVPTMAALLHDMCNSYRLVPNEDVGLRVLPRKPDLRPNWMGVIYLSLPRNITFHLLSVAFFQYDDPNMSCVMLAVPSQKLMR